MDAVVIFSWLLAIRKVKALLCPCFSWSLEAWDRCGDGAHSPVNYSDASAQVCRNVDCIRWQAFERKVLQRDCLCSGPGLSSALIGGIILFGADCLSPSKQLKSESLSVVSDSLLPHGVYSPWNSPGPDTGVGCHFLLQDFLVHPHENLARFCYHMRCKAFCV